MLSLGYDRSGSGDCDDVVEIALISPPDGTVLCVQGMRKTTPDHGPFRRRDAFMFYIWRCWS